MNNTSPQQLNIDSKDPLKETLIQINTKQTEGKLPNGRKCVCMNGPQKVMLGVISMIALGVIIYSSALYGCSQIPDSSRKSANPADGRAACYTSIGVFFPIFWAIPVFFSTFCYKVNMQCLKSNISSATSRTKNVIASTPGCINEIWNCLFYSQEDDSEEADPDIA